MAINQSDNAEAQLVKETLRRVQNRWQLPKGTIFHSNGGSQNTAHDVMEQIPNFSWQQSFPLLECQEIIPEVKAFSPI